MVWLWGPLIPKCVFFGSFQESHFRSDLHVRCHREKIYFGFLSHNFLGVTIHVEKSRKKLGQKVNVKFFRVDPYTLGNGIPQAFQNWSHFHVRCHHEKFENFVLWCPEHGKDQNVCLYRIYPKLRILARNMILLIILWSNMARKASAWIVRSERDFNTCSS